MSKNVELKARLLELKGDSKNNNSAWMSKITPELFKEVLELWLPFVRTATKKQLITTIGIYDTCYNAMKQYSESAPNMEHHIVNKTKVASMNYMVGFTLIGIDKLNGEQIDSYIKFRRNREIQYILENPPSFNSTSPYNNLNGLWSNIASTQLIKEVYEPLYLSLVKNINPDWLGVMEHSFPTRFESN